LEPHFATPSLKHLGLETFDQLTELRFSQSGEPHAIMPKRSWSSGVKRTWDDYDDDDPYDQAYHDQYDSDGQEDYEEYYR
jgi:hypothetical protein